MTKALKTHFCDTRLEGDDGESKLDDDSNDQRQDDNIACSGEEAEEDSWRIPGRHPSLAERNPLPVSSGVECITQGPGTGFIMNSFKELNSCRVTSDVFSSISDSG